MIVTRADKKFHREFGQRVSMCRDIRGISIPTLAKRIGITMGNLKDIEQGRHGTRLLTAMRIANALRVPLSKLTPKEKT